VALSRRVEKEIIGKGANVFADKKQPQAWSNFTLRLRNDISEEIDIRLEKRVGLTKTAWILEAIQEKLNKA
jgi:hypothetical protein